MNRSILIVARATMCCLFLLFAITTANAQFRAGIQGTVTDPNGGLVPEAKITLTNTETGKTQEAVASSDGFYRLENLPPAKYKLTAEKAGYRTKVLDNLTVNAEAVQGLDIVLEPGDVSAVVTVSDEVGQTVQTENANIDKAITTQ